MGVLTLAQELTLSMRNVFRQRARTALTLTAVALGVASIVLSGGYVEDILIQLREATIHSRLGHIQIYAAGAHSSGGQRPFDYLIDTPVLVEKALTEVPGVVAHARRVGFSGLISNGRGELPIIGEGVEPDAENRIGTAVSILTGRRLAQGDRFGANIGEGLAKAMNVKLGDRVNLVLNTREGAMNTLEFVVVGIFRSMSKEFDARAVQIPLPAAAELLDTEGVSAIVVLLDATEMTERAREALLPKLSVQKFEVKMWEELADFYNNTAALYKRQFAVLQLIILVMVLLGVANTVNMTFHERISEFGVMRALGRRGRDIFRLAVIETAVLGVIGSTLGVVLGIALALAISAIGITMPPPPNSESGFVATIRVVPIVVALAFSVGVAAALVASLLPARKIARMPVVDALRQAI